MEKSILENKITQLRDKYFSDPDSQAVVDQYESDIRKLFEESGLKNNEVFIEIAKDAQNRLNEIEALILNDEGMTLEERKVLFKVKKVWKFVFERFSMVPHERAIEALDQLLDSRLAQ